MKKFTILAHNIMNGHCLVITEFKAKTVKEARVRAAQQYMQYLTCNEQLVCANDSQYEEFWRDKVEATDRLMEER